MDQPRWRCKDGSWIDPWQMKMSHLRNCIAMIERNRFFRREWLPYLELVLYARESHYNLFHDGTDYYT